jgi:hypothetical protein
VPAGRIELFGQALAPTATNEYVGEMYLTVPVGSVQDILVRIDNVRKTGRRQILLRIENSKGEFKSVALPFQ